MDGHAARGARVQALKARIEARLLQIAPPAPSGLAAALNYTLSAPGKRLRPLLLMLTAAQFGADEGAAVDAACAVEMVHTASLVLDDLPCMDDSPTRRGRASVHVRFGEDVAVLAAVALLNRAYALIAGCDAVDPAVRLEMIELLSGAVGLEGLVGGQEMDLHSPADGMASLREAHHRKTGVLFMAAAGLGGHVGGASVTEQLALERFAAEFGLAFQACDDVSDAAETEPGGSTRPTLISLLGREGALAEAKRRLTAAKRALACGGPRLEPLCAYVDLLPNAMGLMAEATP